MSDNLLELAKGYLSKSGIDEIAKFLGEDVSAVSKGLEGALPTILGGLMSHVSSKKGLDSLMGLINLGLNSGILDNLGGLLISKSRSKSLLDNGSGLVSTIFEHKAHVVADALSSFSGLKKTSSLSLLSIVTPMLMSVIGKQVKADGLNLSGLVNMLMSQEKYVKEAMPTELAGMAEVLDFDKIGHDDERSSWKNWIKWLVPVIAVLAAVWIFQNCSDDDATEATTVRVAPEEGSVETADVLVDAKENQESGIVNLGEFIKKELPNGVELYIPENGVEFSLLNFIENGMIDDTTWFDFDRLNFASSSSELTTESAEQIKNISEILKAYPEVALKLGGYTDNTGSDKGNLKLSQSRANKVMTEILDGSIEESRLEAEGYGSAHPVASNDTEEGKAQNRRIALRVTKK